MARVESDALEHQDLERIFIAARLTEARRAEEVLTLEGVEYVVNVEPFVAGGFFAFWPRKGAGVFVPTTPTPPPPSEVVGGGGGGGGGGGEG